MREQHGIRVRFVVVATAWLASAGLPVAAAVSDPPAVPVASAVRARGPIVVDGRLGEETWSVARPIADLVQRQPNEGQPATERTEVRFAYDDSALYVGARMYDRDPRTIDRRLSRRDANMTTDLLRVFLDPHHDHKTGVLLTVSAGGSRTDAAVSNDFEYDFSWDGVWDAAVSVDGEGWIAEIRIPFSQLRFSPAGRQTWGLNVVRIVNRTNESDWWSLVSMKDTRLVSALGHLEGLEGIHPRRHLDVLPYVTTRAEHIGTTAVGDPFNGVNRALGGAGVDVKWGLTSSFTVDAAVNPDFGQAEVDPAVVNLTAFETFYQEKRPFFIEGAQQFGTFGRNGIALYGRFGAQYPQLLYSRRIGRAPHLSPSGEFVDAPGATTILGAAKVTGRTSGGWSLAALDALTGRESARLANGDARSDVETEPLTNYAAARASRDLGGRGAVGFLATLVTRDLRSPEMRQAVGNRALVGGVDTNVYLDRGRRWVVSGSFAGSRVDGDAAAIARLQRSSARYYQRPDATHVRFDPAARSLSGWTGQVELNRTRGNLIIDSAVWAISPGFESNDLGYSPAADRVGAHTGWMWQKTSPDRLTRDRTMIVLGRWLGNTAGDTLSKGINVQFYGTLENYWTFTSRLNTDFSFLDDRSTRGGPMMWRPAARTATVGLETDTRKPVSWAGVVEAHKNGAGGWYAQFSPSLRVRPSSSLTVSFGPSVLRYHAVNQYVTSVADVTAARTYGGRTVFSTLDRSEVALESRLNVIFTPKASLEVYAQPLISAARYSDLKEFARPRTFDFMRYGVDGGSLAYDPATRVYTIDPDATGAAPGFRIADPDFNYRSLRVNAVFRWEWRLGSTLYAVWTQQREDLAPTGGFAFGRDMRGMAAAPGDHVFMVKVAYWVSR